MCLRKLVTPFIEVGGDSLAIKSIFAISNLIPFPEILCPKIMPSRTMKRHYSKFNTRLVSSRPYRTFSKFFKKISKDSLKREKSFINIFTVYSTI